MFYKPNSAAVTSVTATWTASANNVGAIVYEISGADGSSPADGSVNSNVSGSSITSLTSGSLVTANANDILIYGARSQSNETTWTAGSGYTIPANGSNTRQGVQYKVVSSTQSGVTTSMSWNNGAPGAAGIFAAFKAASGIGGSASSVTATAGTPQSATINTAFATQLQATVKDSLNNPVSGVVVTFTPPATGASGTFAGGVNTATTNASGVATSGVFTANGTAGGPYNVVASATGATSANFALTNTAASQGKVATTSGSGQSATINAAFGAPLVATVTDASNNPVSGVVVTFTPPAAGASGTFAGGVNTATTNASGVATSGVFTANSTAGSYNVVASAPNASSVNFALTNTAGPAANVTATSGSGQSAAINTAFAAPLVATITDAGNNPVSGVVVTFTPPATGVSGTFAGGVNTATTNASGVATSGVFTANATAGGPYNVVASATGATSANFSLTNNSQAYALSVSISSDRNYASGLQGASLAGLTYVFTSPASQLTNFSPSGITSVSYWLDNPSMTGSPMHTQSVTPYDFAGPSNTPAAGLAKPWDTTTVPDGTHTITQSVLQSNGSTEVDTATFTVQNNLSTSITSGRYEYVFPDQNIFVYSLDTFQLVKHVSMPQLNAIRGVAVVPSTHMLYISYGGAGGSNGNGFLLKYDLLTDTVIWAQSYSFGVDAFAITPDGSTIYMPDGASSGNGIWEVLNASTGAVTGSINTGMNGPHNTVVSLDGTKVFMGPINSADLVEGNTSTNTVALNIGPLHQGVRPFSINGKHTLAFTTANTASGIGFQVSDTTTGNVLYSVDSGFTIPSGFTFNSPVHGISLSPNEKEIYLIDTANAYAHVFDVSGLPSVAPVAVAHIPLTTNFSGYESPCSPLFNCVREGWIRHTLDGRYVLVDDSGNVIDTTTRQVVNTIPQLLNTRKGNLEIDWQGGLPVATSTHYGLGYVTGTVTATAGTPQSAAINTAFATQLQATVKDISNNPMSGVLVTFTAPASGASGTFAGGVNTATTNASGVATSAVFTSNAIVGSYNVVASAPNAPSVNFALTNTAGTPATVMPTAGTPQSAAVNTAFATPLQATVKDSLNNPVSGVTVTFTAPASGASGTFAGGVNTATTNASGVATSAVFTANTTAGGPYTVTATVAGVATPANFSLTNLAPPSFSLVQAAQGFSASGGNAITVPISTTSGNLLVIFCMNGGNNSTTVTITDSAGQTWTQTASGYASSASSNRSAMFYKPNSAAVTSVTATWTASANNVGAIVYEISGADGSSPADGSVNSNVSGSSITSLTSGSLVTANANDILIYGARSQSNETTWTAGSGYTIPANGSNTRQGVQYKVVSSTQSGVTTSMSWNNGAPGAAGIFAAFKAASGIGGSASSVTATAGTPQSATINTAFATQLQATVKDSLNNPVSGVVVTFTPPATGASGTFAGGVNTATTNASGVATSGVFTANGTAGGPYNLVASAIGAKSANFSLTNLAGAPASITATAGTPQNAAVNTAFATQLKTAVKDASNNPVSGVTVTFTAPATGATGTFAGGVNTAITDAQGVATAPVFTANGTAGGPYTVTATVAGVASPANFSLTNFVQTTGGYALVQHTSVDAGTTTSATLAFKANNTAGNWIAVVVRAGLGNETITVADSIGNTYHSAVQSTQSGITVGIFYAENIKGGANTVTVSDTASATLRFALLEYSGVATLNSLDATASALGASTSPNSGNATTTLNGDLLLGAIATVNPASYTAGSGYTIEESIPAEPNTKLIVEDVQSAAGAVSASATLAASNNWSAILAAFKSVNAPLSISPRVSDLTFTRTQQFAATAAVNWLVDGVLGGSTSSGTITSTGLYTPPNAVGTHTVTAEGPSQSANATVYITNYPGTFMRDVDTFRTGQNLSETVLTPVNVNQAQFGKLSSYSIDGVSDASPLYVANVNIPGQGFHNVVYVATEHDSVYAFDADGLSGNPLWQVSFLNSTAGTTVTTLTPSDTGDFGNNMFEAGITGTPVIDPGTGTLYVVAVTKEVTGSVTNYVQRLHALDITTGAEKFGGPVVIQANVSGSGAGGSGGQVPFQAVHENQRAALLLTNGIVYIAWASHGDHDPYHGWVMGYNAGTLQQAMVYNTTPNGSRGGIWQSGDGLTTDSTGRLYFVTGNGLFDVNTGGSDYGDSIVAINTNGTVADYFTPHDQASMSSSDLDLGSGGALLLPDQAGAHPHEALSSGKNGTIYVVDRDAMGHFNSSNDNQIVQTLVNILPGGTFMTGNFKSPVYFNGSVYFSADSDTIKSFSITNGLLSTSPTSQTGLVAGYPGATLQISANGSTHGILWAIQRFGPADQSANSTAPGILHAYDATNLANELYNSNQATGGRDALDFVAKWAAPLIANGKVFVASNGRLTVFGLLP
jgi:hypothetical protein